MDIIGDSTLTTLKAPGAVAADASTAGVDCRSLIGQGAIILTALNTAGTNPTMAIKLQGTQDADVVTSVTPGTNAGNGTCTQVYGGPDAVAEDITLTFSNATTAAVVGAVSGARGNATVGTLFSDAVVEFMLTSGSAAFESGDTFVIVTTARTYADVAGGDFTSLTGANQASIQKKSINFDQAPRYLRVNFDIGGTVSPSYTLAVAAQSLTN
jgi:hypothetical protein